MDEGCSICGQELLSLWPQSVQFSWPAFVKQVVALTPFFYGYGYAGIWILLDNLCEVTHKNHIPWTKRCFAHITTTTTAIFSFFETFFKDTVTL